MIPCVEMSNKLTNSNLKKKLKKKLILFFCGAKEFYHWHGDIALQIFKKLPNDYFMIILGEVPPEELSKLNDDELKRIKTGIVNDFSYIKSIFEETMVLLAMNRQIVSYSVLESIYYNIVCLFSDKITSYSNGNISRLENAGGIYIQSDNIDDYVNAILQLQRNPQMFLEHISTQKRFIQEGYHLEKVVKQFIMDNF